MIKVKDVHTAVLPLIFCCVHGKIKVATFESTLRQKFNIVIENVLELRIGSIQVGVTGME